MSNTKSQEHNNHKNLLKTASKISFGTLVSRILGFFRDILFANLLGTSFAGDAFFIAFRIPNMFRNFVAEGATNAAVVPVMSEYLQEKERNKFWELVSVIITWAFIILSLISLLGILFAPFILKIIVPGFLSNTEKYFLAVKLTRILFPYLILIGMTAYLVGILHTFRSFTVPAFSPCLLNISVIISALAVSFFSAQPVFVLAFGVIIGGMMQLFVQLIPLKKVGFKYKFPTNFYHEGAKKIGKLMVPRMIGSGVYQINILVDSFCASLSSIVGMGGISAIYYANRIVNLPLGLFAVALSSVLLPDMSRLAAQKDYDGIKNTLKFSLNKMMLIMIPISVITILFSGLIIKLLFQRGAFDAYSTSITSLTLSFYAIGLCAFSANKILITCFHSMHDTKTPVKIAFVCLILNAVLNFVLMYPLKIGGIALASSVSGIVNFLFLYILFEKKIKSLKLL